MSTTQSATQQPNPVAAKPPRSPVERIIVWGGILALLAVVGVEYSAQRSYQNAWTVLNDKLEEGEKPNSKGSHITNLDGPRLLGREPDFKGHPGQIKLNSQYYEIYAFRSLLKRKFSPPPENPEVVDIHAIYSGDVRPDLIKYRTPEKRDPTTFFSAPLLYVYYGMEDKNSHTREVISILTEREKYYDEFTPIPDKDELKKRHEANMESMFAGMAKSGMKITPEMREQLDTWKHPQAQTTENTDNLPDFAGKPKSSRPNPAPTPDKFTSTKD